MQILMELEKVLLLTICSILCTVFGQEEDCVAGQVENLGLHHDFVLAWEVNPNEPCEITQFQVDVIGGDEEYHFKVTDLYANISFVQDCRDRAYTVTPISHDTIGYPRVIFGFIPLPSDTDLTLTSFNVSSTGGTGVILQWEIRSQPIRECTLHFRITLTDEDTGNIQDFYVMGRNSLIDFGSPCLSFQINIRAVNVAHNPIEGNMLTTYYATVPSPQIPPRLNSFNIEPTAINMTWELQGIFNRCPLRALYIDILNFANVTVPLMNEVNPEPVLVELKSLQPNRMYFMRVYVENSGGISDSVPIGFQTPELTPG